jgi:hypothetical protein
MQGKQIRLNGANYIRNVEYIGDVEKITYTQVILAKEDLHHNLYIEIYDQEFAYALEMAYEDMLTFEFTPQPFFI